MVEANPLVKTSIRYSKGYVNRKFLILRQQARRKRPKSKIYCVLVLGHLSTRNRNTELQRASSFPYILVWAVHFVII
eukprot:3033287-Pleurochrysis_carterae.AAC.7